MPNRTRPIGATSAYRALKALMRRRFTVAGRNLTGQAGPPEQPGPPDRRDERWSNQGGLTAMLDALPSMFGYWDRQLVNRMMNKAYRELLVAHRASMPDVPLRLQGVDPLFGASEAQVASALRGESVTYEHSLAAREGAPARHLLVHLIPDLLEGDVQGFYLAAHDVSAIAIHGSNPTVMRRENEGLLGTLNQRALVSVADRSGRIIDANAHFCAISGYTRAELLGQDHRLVSSGTHSSAFWKEMWQETGAGKPWRAEVCNRAKDGSLYWVDSIITPFFGVDGRISKYVAVRFDITAHKEAQRRLVESELFLQRVEKVSGVGGFTIDLATGAQQWTRQSYHIRGVDEGCAPTQELVDMFVSREARERFAQTTRVARDSGEGYDLEMPMVTETGRSIWIRMAAEVEFADGVPVRLVGAMEDITKRRAMDHQLRDAMEIAERANKAKSEFLANMSHEIRTPLNAVIGLGYLLEQTTLSEDQLQFLTKIQFSGRALLSVVNNVLDLSKIEAGEMSLEDERFDLPELVRDIAQMLAPQATSKGIDLIVQRAPTLPRMVRGDVSCLRQILTNLVNNAVKFTEIGQVNVEVFTTEQTAARIRLRCVVTDTGIGIEPAALESLFTPFTQADASTTRRFGGTGLGLSIARRLVELMGGEIGVSSTVPGGSTFWFEVPLGVAALIKGETVPSEAMRVLIADSNGDVPGGLAAMVRALGWTATVAESGEHLIAILGSTARIEWPQVLILDLPGAETRPDQLIAHAEAIRPGGEPPPIIVVSDFGQSWTGPEPLIHSTEAVLIRPVTSSALFNAINSAVSRRNEGRQRRLESTAQEEARAQWLCGVRVLVVDDSEINLEVARRILEKHGAIVASCPDGLAAVEYLRSHPLELDVVLMDIQMPILDGNEATRRIRNELGMSALPIVALTAGALVGERQRSLEAGVNDFVSKPFDPIALIRIVRRLVEGTRGEPIPIVRVDGHGPLAATSMVLMTSIDAAVVKQMFGDDLALFKALLIRLLRDYEDLAFATALAVDDPGARTALMARTHKLKGSSGMIGASRVMRLAGAAENALQGNRAGETVERILGELAAALTALREESEPFLAANPVVETLPEVTVDGPHDGDLKEIEDLYHLLDRQDLRAIDRCHTLSAELTRLLGPADFARLKVSIDDLDFHLGAERLRRHCVTLCGTSGSVRSPSNAPVPSG